MYLDNLPKQTLQTFTGLLPFRGTTAEFGKHLEQKILPQFAQSYYIMYDNEITFNSSNEVLYKR